MLAKTAVTFRTPMKVKDEAMKNARKIGIPLSLVLTNALKNFSTAAKVVITENGFTPEFEEKTLHTARRAEKSPKQLKPMSKEEFLDSLR